MSICSPIQNVGLKTFSGTFEVLVRDAKTLKVRGVAAKTCQFPTRELIRKYARKSYQSLFLRVFTQIPPIKKWRQLQ